MSYPESEKVHAVREKSQAIGEFLDWLHNEKELTVCRHDEDGRTIVEDDVIAGAYLPECVQTEKLLMEFFDIDGKALEEEKRAMLAELQEARVKDVLVEATKVLSQR